MSWAIFICRRQLPLNELPEERMMFTLGMYGDGDFYAMKGVVEEFLDKLGMRKDRNIIRKQENRSCIRAVRRRSSTKGTVTRVIWVRFIRRWRTTMESASRAYVAVIDIPNVMECATFDRKYDRYRQIPGSDPGPQHGSSEDMFWPARLSMYSYSAEEKFWRVISCLIFMRARRSKRDTSPWLIP